MEYKEKISKIYDSLCQCNMSVKEIMYDIMKNKDKIVLEETVTIIIPDYDSDAEWFPKEIQSIERCSDGSIAFVDENEDSFWMEYLATNSILNVVDYLIENRALYNF